MNDIFISVIVPIYNKKPFLKEALDSVKAALSGISGEVICMDNGSDDGSAEVLDDYVKDNPRFQAFHMEKIGAAAARNIGIKKARGKYLAFVDADDKVTENLYRDMLYICETNNLNLCICNITRFEEKNKGVVSVQY